MGVISKDPVGIQHSFLCLRAAFLLWPGSMYHTRHTEGTERGISRRTSGYKACSTREQEALSSQALHMAVCFLVAIRLDRQGGTYTAQTQAPRGSSRPRASATEIEQAVSVVVGRRVRVPSHGATRTSRGAHNIPLFPG